MLNRWRAKPPFTRMWIACGVVWLPLLLLEAILGLILGHTREWDTVFVSLVVIGGVTSGTFWVLGVIRFVQFARAKRLGNASNTASPGPEAP
jgi:hypothetical protein